MRRWEQRLIAVAFVSWLAAPLAFLAFGARSGYAALEKRRPASLRKPTLDALVDPRFYARVARVFGDRVPLRIQALALDSWLDLELFGDSPNPEVLTGSDGWLFSAEAVTAPCRDPIPPARAVDRIRRTSRILHASGRRLVFLVAPDKAAVYPERLGRWTSAGRCAARSRLRALLRRAELPGYVDLWRAMEELKARSDEDVYWPHDTHWTRLGALEAARRIVDRLDPTLWDDGAVVARAGQRVRGDLANMIGLPRWHRATRYKVRRGVRVETHQRGIYRRLSTTGKAARFRPRVLSIYDSFGRMYDDLVSQYLGDSTWVFWHAFRKEGLAGIIDELARAEVVILETVERDVISRFARYSRDLPVRLVGRLAGELSATDLELRPASPAAGSRGPTLELPPAARGVDRYLIVDVASPQAARGIRIAVRSRDDRPWRPVRAIEVAQAGGGRRLVAELPGPRLTVSLGPDASGVRSARWLDLGD